MNIERLVVGSTLVALAWCALRKYFQHVKAKTSVSERWSQDLAGARLVALGMFVTFVDTLQSLGTGAFLEKWDNFTFFAVIL